jgi:hypothetical protein
MGKRAVGSRTRSMRPGIALVRLARQVALHERKAELLHRSGRSAKAYAGYLELLEQYRAIARLATLELGGCITRAASVALRAGQSGGGVALLKMSLPYVKRAGRDVVPEPRDVFHRKVERARAVGRAIRRGKAPRRRTSGCS